MHRLLAQTVISTMVNPVKYSLQSAQFFLGSF